MTIKNVAEQGKNPKYVLYVNNKYVEYIGNAKALAKWKKKQESLQLPHVAHNNGNNEWYTPPTYIEAARRVMGSIDTDPASTTLGNKIVKATVFYTAKDDGRGKPWRGNVWLNPPYAQPLISDFCQLLLKKYWDKELSQACLLINNASETNFFQDVLANCNAVCFIKGRVRFLDSDGRPGAPLQGQTILYFGNNNNAFIAEFARYGVILHGNC